MTRRRLFLMRHAETEFFGDRNRLHTEDTPLTRHGQAQAAAAAAALADVTFDRVITSGTRRTNDTARIVLADREGPVPEEWPELGEIRSGKLEDLSAAEIDHTFHTFLSGVSSDSATLFGGETIGELVTRITPVFAQLRADKSWDTALAVLHGVVNRAILSLALTAGNPRLLFGGIEQGPACINILDIGDTDTIVRVINHSPVNWTHNDDRATTMEHLHQRLPR